MTQLRSNAIVPFALTLALAALAGAGCGSGETPPSAPPAAAPAPSAAPEPAAPAPPAPAPEATPPAPSGAVMEWQGELPRSFPSDVPQYPGAKVTSAQETGELVVAVTFESPDSIEAVAKYYADSLASQGWQTQTQEGEDGVMVLGDKDDRVLQALVHAGEQGTLVDLIIAPAQ